LPAMSENALKEWAARKGYRVAWAPGTPLGEVQREIAARAAKGEMQSWFAQKWLGWLTETQSQADAQPETVIVVAVPCPACTKPQLAVNNGAAQIKRVQAIMTFSIAALFALVLRPEARIEEITSGTPHFSIDHRACESYFAFSPKSSAYRDLALNSYPLADKSFVIPVAHHGAVTIQVAFDLRTGEIDLAGSVKNLMRLVILNE
jgi:hypothetical protein